MAVVKQEVVVCDVCKSPAAQPITLSVTVKGVRKNFTKDLCAKHIEEYLTEARPSRPGRRSGVYAEMTSKAKKARTQKTQVESESVTPPQESNELVAASV